MLGANKKNSTGITDETLKDQSNKQVISLFLLLFVTILVIGLYVLSYLTVNSQKKLLAEGNTADEKLNSIMLNLASLSKQSEEKEYEKILLLKNIMSPEDFKTFVNSISGIAGSHNININSLKDEKPVAIEKLKKYAINYEVVAIFSDYLKFKNELIETEFKINFEEISIVRETPLSKKIKINGIISAIVLEDKVELLKKNEKLIKKMEALKTQKAKTETKKQP